MALTERYQGFTVSRVLSQRATSDPESLFVLTRGARLTYGDADAKAEALAASLANLGVTPGDRVAIVLPPCPEFVISLFAVAKLTAIAVPLDPRLTDPELQYNLRHSGAVGAVIAETLNGIDNLHVFEELTPLLPELQFLVTVGEDDLWYDDRVYPFQDLVSAGAGRDFPMSDLDPTIDPFAIVYTSGTTGKPKGVELTHQNLIHPAAATGDAVRLEPGDRVVGVTALFHAFGLGPGIIGSALVGAGLLLQDRFDPAECLDLVESERATVHYGVPTVFAAELREQRVRARDLSTLRVGVVAGAPMPESLFQAVEEEICPNLLTAYSLTEASSTVAITGLNDSPEVRRMTVGRPVADTQIRVLDPAGDELPVESVGELAVRGPGVMKGYYRQPNETAAGFSDGGFFRVGDLGIVDEDGYVHLVGRSNGVMIRGGSNVYPREIEDRLHAHPAVREAAVVGVEDELLGEAICASIVPVEGAIVTEDEIREWCRRTLADHKVPDEVTFLDELPMTGTGKVRRVELARLLKEARQGPST